MNTPAITRPPVRLPDIPLSKLPERTKDFIIAASCSGTPIMDVLVGALNTAASDAGFTPRPRAK